MRKLYALIILLFLAIYILPLGVRPMITPDELRYAEIPREIIATGDWVVPRLNGLRYFEKPILGYWLNALSILAWGENAFAIRFPSAMAAGLSALLVFLLVRKSSGSREAGLLAAGILLTSTEFFALGIYSVLDGVVSAFLTAAMVSFFMAYRAEQVQARILWLILFGVACGAAFLTKGFLAFVVPAVAIVPFLVWERRWKSLFTIPWIPIAAAVLVGLHWVLEIHARESDYWHYFFWVEHIQRFSSDNPQHPEPFWYYIPVLLVAMFPWTPVSPAAMAGLKRTRLRGSMTRFALCWFLCPFLFFSASEGKIATYILPCLPPLAILLSTGFFRYFEQGHTKAFNIGCWISVAAGILLCIALLVNELTGFPKVRAFLPAESWKWTLLCIGTVAWAMSSLMATIASDTHRKLVLLGLSPVLLMFCAHFAMPQQFADRRAPGDFLLQFSSRVTPETAIVTDSNLIHAVCWFFKRNDVYLLDSLGELEYGIGYEDSRQRALDIDGFNRLVTEHCRKGKVVLIGELRDLETYWGHHIPQPRFEGENAKFFYAEFGPDTAKLPDCAI